MANDLQNQGQAMVGDMQGQVNQQQDKFKKKVSQVLIRDGRYQLFRIDAIPTIFISKLLNLGPDKIFEEIYPSL